MANLLAASTSRRWLSWPLIIGCLAVAFACFEARYLYVDDDTLWHLFTGEWIWQHRQAPTTDVFSHTFYGKPWVSHEWFASLIFYLMFSIFSWQGPAAITALSFGMAVGLTARFLFQRLAPVRALFVTMLVLTSLATHLLARPHVLAMPLLVVWVMQCVQSVENQKTPPLWLVAVMVLWSNIHGSFIVGLLMTVLFAMDAVIEAKGARRKTIIGGWAVFILVTFLATLVTPHHVHGLLFPFQLQKMEFMLSVISEWRSPNFQNFEPQEAWILGLFFLGWIFRIQVSWVRLVLLAYVIHLSLVHTRHLTLLAIVAPLILATPFQRALPDPPDRRTDRLSQWLVRWKGSANPLLSVFAGLAVVWLSLVSTQQAVKPPKNAMPEQAIAFLREHPQTGKVFNSYDYGGALIMEKIPVFIDGRAEVYGDEFLKQTNDAEHARPGTLFTTLDQYDISWTFLKADNAAVQVLDLAPQWKRIYADDLVVMHRRKK